MKTQLLDIIKATFQPKRLDTLRDSAKPYIGKIGYFEHSWTNEDNELYPGQIAYTPVTERFVDLIPGHDFDTEIYNNFKDFAAGWVPEEDLIKVEVLKRTPNK